MPHAATSRGRRRTRSSALPGRTAGRRAVRAAGQAPTPDPVRTRATPITSTRQRSRTTTALTRPTPTSRARHRACRSPPTPAFTPPPCLRLRPLPGCLPLVPYFPVLMLVLVPLMLAVAPPPAIHHHPWAGLPRCLFCRSRKGGPARQRWTPLPRKPRRQAKLGPEAGRRHGGLLRPPARDHQQEITRRAGSRPGHTAVVSRASLDLDASSWPPMGAEQLTTRRPATAQLRG
jgi:hypothetical protein